MSGLVAGEFMKTPVSAHTVSVVPQGILASRLRQFTGRFQMSGNGMLQSFNILE